MVIDLDRFKIMNDYLGHGSGDRLLVTIADRIRTSIRTNDFAARLGGDEFVFIVDKAKSEMEILATAYRMLDVIAQPVAIAGQEVTHTASIGIAMAEPGEQSGLDLLGWADVAMYAAKARGRNQAVVFDRDLREEVNDRSRTELMLREAIEMGGLRLHFQPEVDLRTGQVLAVEALVRWEHPTRGLLAAQEFIPVAEETGLVTELGRWVFAEACRQLAIWQKDYPNLPFIVRINMSPADFKMGDLVEFVERCLVENNVPGNRLCIEITEYVVVDEPDRIAKILKSFQALGVEIALDDFGTGFASMTGLKNLPVEPLEARHELRAWYHLGQLSTGPSSSRSSVWARRSTWASSPKASSPTRSSKSSSSWAVTAVRGTSSRGPFRPRNSPRCSEREPLPLRS